MTFHGTQSEVISQMAMYHKAVRQDMLNRKLAARLRKEALDEQADNKPRVRFDAGWTKQGGYFGC